jgi:Domain of unknown function (DUF4399)
MYKKIVPIAISLLVLAACNNSGKEKEAEKDTTTTKMEGMDHTTAPGTTIPDLPAVPDGAKVYFVNLKNNATVSSPLKIQMGTTNIKVDTAGPVVAGSGHHHLLIDGPDSLAAGSVVAKDSVNLHFGKGQTETEIKLSPGKHKLTLQFADGLHRAYGGKLSATIMVNVKK